MSNPRAVRLFNEWVEAKKLNNQFIFTYLTRENVHWSLIDHVVHSKTLGELILLKTGSLSAITYLINVLGVDVTPHIAPVLSRCISWGTAAKHWRFLLDCCHPKCEPEQLTSNGPFFWSPLGRAISMGDVDGVRVFLEYGCRLPLGESIPTWAWKIQDQVVCKKHCGNAIIAILGIGRRKRGPWRDLCTLFAQALWPLRYNQEWSKLL